MSYETMAQTMQNNSMTNSNWGQNSIFVEGNGVMRRKNSIIDRMS